MGPHLIRVNRTTNQISDWQGDPISSEEIICHRGDDILFCFWLVENTLDINGILQETDVDLSADLDHLRLDIDSRKGDHASGVDLAYQDVYNQESLGATYEDLSAGKFTFNVNFGAAAVATALGTADFITAWWELAAQVDGKSKTFGQAKLQIHEQLNDGAGAPGSPAGSYSTTAESKTLFLESDQQEVTAASITLAQKEGRHRVRSNVSSGTPTITLPDPTLYDTEEKREATIEIEFWGTVCPDIDVDGGSTIYWYGSSGATYSSGIQYGVVEFRTDGANWAIFTRLS